MTPEVSTLDVVEAVRALSGDLVLRDRRLVLLLPSTIPDSDLVVVRALVSEHRGALYRVLAGDVLPEDNVPWKWASCPVCGAERRHGHPARCGCNGGQDRLETACVVRL